MGDRPHNYVSNDIFCFAVSPGFTKILLIQKCIIFYTPCISSYKTGHFKGRGRDSYGIHIQDDLP